MIKVRREILLICVCSSISVVFGYRVSPVYSRGLDNKSDNDSIEIIVGSSYSVANPVLEARSSDVGDMFTNSSDDDDDFYLIQERNICWNNDSTLSACWRYGTLKFIRDMVQSPSTDIFRGRNTSLAESSSPFIVNIPSKHKNLSIAILGRSDGKSLGEMYRFLERQLIQFISKHGVVFSMITQEEAERSGYHDPVLLDEENIEDGRKTKTKKSVLFPMLILFKFFKIKMILVPILLSVLLVKKMLILTLALAPNILGFFRLCRPPGFGGPAFVPPLGLASAGVLQDITDSRGEFSSIYNTYANPYRDHHSHGYRNRETSRYTGNALSHDVGQADSIPSDY